MTQVTVLGLSEVRSLTSFDLDEFDAIVGFIDSGQHNDIHLSIFSSIPKHKKLIIRKDDVEFVTGTHPTPDDIKQALEFVKDKHNVLVFCHAGMCRSPALGIGILIQAGNSVKFAVERMKDIRPQLFPNILIAELIDNILELDFDLVEAINNLRSRIIVFDKAKNRLFKNRT